MSLVDDFSEIQTKIDVACMAAVQGGLRDALLRKIEEKATTEVYSYAASGRAMAERRYTIGTRGVMDVSSGGGGGEFWVKVINRAYLQNPGGADESDVVEGGWASYKQPGPREFMQPAADELVNSGEADSILQQYLAMYGIDI